MLVSCVLFDMLLFALDVALCVWIVDVLLVDWFIWIVELLCCLVLLVIVIYYLTFVFVMFDLFWVCDVVA